MMKVLEHNQRDATPWLLVPLPVPIHQLSLSTAVNRRGVTFEPVRMEKMHGEDWDICLL